MSWTSTNAQPNTGVERPRNPISIYALIATGLGLGMLFSHALQFADICSGSTPYLRSWILLFTTIGAGLGHFGANKLIATSSIHRWGLVGWAGLVTGISAWLMPFISQKLASFWMAPGTPDGFLLVPALLASVGLGLLPGCFAGLSIGATYHTSTNPHHPHHNKPMGWILLTGSVGFLLAELLLIQKFGLEFSNPMTALVWLLIGAGGLIAKAGNPIQEQPLANEYKTAQTRESSQAVQTDRMGIYLGLTAACFLTVWMRISDWVFGDTFFWSLYWPCLALMALGIGLLAPIAKVKSSTRNMTCGLAVLGAFLFCLLFTFDDMPFWLHHLRSQLGETTVSFPIHVLVFSIVIGGLLFGPLYGLGCLTHYSAHFQLSTTKVSLSVQMVLSTAISWTVLQHFIMPMLGLARVAGLGIATLISLAIYFAFRSREKWKGLSKIVAPVSGILLISFTGSHFDKKWRHIFSQSNDVATGFFSTREEANKWAYRSDQIAYKESAYGSVAIQSYDYPGNSQLELRINGEVIERGYVHQIKPVINTMVPYILHGTPKHVAVFGLRSGSAAGILASLPTIKQVDGVEYNVDLLSVIGKFASSNGNLLQRDSFHFYNTTPSRFLHQSQEELDIIINQYARPWKSLNTPWFSLEFYEECANRLSKEGLMVQNIQASHLDDPTLETVIATFGSVFNQTSIWKLGHGEWMLIGTRDKREWSLDLLKARIQTKEVQFILNTQELETWPMLLTTQISGFDKGFHLVPDESLMHSRNYPALRMLGNNAFASPSPLTVLENANEHFIPKSSLILGNFAQTNPWTIDQLRAFSILQMDHQLYDPKVFRSVVKRWLNLSPDETTLQILSASTSKAESPWTYESARLNALISSFPADTEPPLELVKQAAFHSLQRYRDERTFIHRPDSSFLEAMLDHMIQKDPVNQRVYRMNLAELAWDEGKTEAFLKFSEEAFDPDIEKFGPVDYSAEPMAPYKTLALMAEHWWKNGQLEKAKQVCIQALQANYIGPEAVFNHRELEQVVRKVLFTLDLPSQAANGTESNLEIEAVE
jgi:spermidine synthase